MEYEEIVTAIKEAPLTQLGAIMITAVKECQKRKFFADDESLLITVNRVVDNYTE